MKTEPVARIEPFFHRATGTLTYLVHDGAHAAIIDPVAAFSLASGRLSYAPSDEIVARVETQGLVVDWILETHAHADHLSGGDYLRARLGARLGIGRGIESTQDHFEPLFGMNPERPPRQGAFDRLFDHGDRFDVGSLSFVVMATPGHTDDSVTYRTGSAAFIGDTLFSPARGTARCDFPGGDAARLYRTVRKFYALPGDTRLYLCHDYPDEGCAPVVSVSVREQRAANAHVTDQTSEAQFVALRRARDATLNVPALMLPALQVNIRGGALPAADTNGTRYLQLPINRL